MTQMHGFGLTKRTRWVIFTIYATMAVAISLGWRGTSIFRDLLAIPIIDYLLVFVLSWITWITIKLVGTFQNRSNVLE